ncbi:tRNA threonylcarbamoyladenosine dehydratase [uncultured Faecalicoccus sp.]|uniref:tRNA threonylcarbamoyladenosine dehydratase n=1 Tax=uncultured Faecalicoccus sp. TaxID=1971760 RepID=UPI002634DB39|nr:tRNA threonylcarbamoyladenosine dehydratase [uncultured Faecalicoccus sp.]
MENKRTEALFGKEAAGLLSEKTVMVFGAGGVGSFCIEALARTGIGHLILIDADVFEPSNLNRQLMATTLTLNQKKVEVCKERILSINEHCRVDAYCIFYDKTKEDELFSGPVDFVIDCIDSISSKQDLIQACLKRKIPFLSCMGTARKKDPSQLKIMELEKTSYDPLAKRLRQWKRKEKIKEKIWVVSSTEAPSFQKSDQPLASAIFVPASAGILLASACVQRLISTEG